MTLEQYTKFYDVQANMLIVVDRMTAAAEQMEAAITGAVDRMAALLKLTEKTDTTASNMKSPIESMFKSLSGKAVAEKVDWGALLNPQNLAISLAIGVGWQLFGDDIMTILTPAMGVLESFAGMVHGLLAAVAPVFSPVVWVLGLVAQMLDYMAANMGAIIPMVLGIAGAVVFWNAQMIAGTVAGWASAAATWVQHASVSAYLVQLNLLTTAQRILNAVMNASPMMKGLGIVMLLAGGFALLIEKTGSVKNAWASVVNFFLDGYNFIVGIMNKLLGTNFEIKAHMALDPVPEAEKTENAVQAKQESAYSLAQPVTMPDTSAWMAQTPDYSAMTPQMPDYDALSMGNSVYAGGISGADWSGEPLAVDTVGILESVTGAVTISEETMGGLGVMMAENRPEITVAPNIVINATVREEADIRKLVSGIEQVLEEEFRAGVEGVYSGTGGRRVSC